MALSHGIEYEKVNGCFTEKTYKKRFEYSDAILSDWDKKHGFTHRIYVGGFRDGTIETRPAVIKKTVAIVCTDEDEHGMPVTEKWQIKHEWTREVK